MAEFKITFNLWIDDDKFDEDDAYECVQDAFRSASTSASDITVFEIVEEAD